MKKPATALKGLSATLTKVQGAIFDTGQYDWYTFQGPRPINLDFRGQQVPVNPGDKFGVRPATSRPKRGEDPKVRVITKRGGPGRVISMTEGEVDNKLLNWSAPTRYDAPQRY